MRVKLTKRSVEAVAPGTKDVLVWDSEVPGFGLKVTPSGKRVYFAYYRMPSGQQRRPKIGEHGVLTVDQARDIARQWMARAAAGEDVSKEKQASREAGTVADLASRYLTDYAEVYKKARSVETDRSNIENHVLPLIGSIRVKDITRQDIDRMKLAIRDGKSARKLKAKPRGRRVIKGGEGIANRVVALTSKMFACAVEWGLRDDNPARGIRKFEERRKDRFLDEQEIDRLLKVLDAADASRTVPIAGTTAIRVLLFTGMRYSEVMELKWGEVDASRQCFRLADSKTGARVIPYGQAVADALKALSRGTSQEYVFPGSKAEKPLALRRVWYRLRDEAKIDASATLHTLRHTFASWSVMRGLSLHQVGAVLGHKSPQTTMRYADHAMEAIRGYSDATSAMFVDMQRSK